MFKYYYGIQNSLAINNECLYFDDRVVIPFSLQKDILNLLHNQHVGIVRMKLLARTTVWWRGIDKEIYEMVKVCEACSLNQKNVKDCKNSKWSTTTYFYERVHIDLFHFGKFNFLISWDSFSKWIDVHLLSRTNAEQVILKLMMQFSVMGLPKKLVSDNGPPFQSKEFRFFCQSNDIELVHSPPYHPEINGLAERAVQTVKVNLKKLYVVNTEI